MGTKTGREKRVRAETEREKRVGTENRVGEEGGDRQRGRRGWGQRTGREKRVGTETGREKRVGTKRLMSTQRTPPLCNGQQLLITTAT